jgi:hypothetical protein
VGLPSPNRPFSDQRLSTRGETALRRLHRVELGNLCTLLRLCISGREKGMNAIAQQIFEIENRPVKLCGCGKRYELIRTMLHIRTSKPVRMFECRCGERHWEE